jgi:restriction system protein
MPVPTYDGLFNPLLKALRDLGGSASVSEQEDKVAELLKLSEDEVAEIHRGNRTKLSYRLAWARNYLKRFGLIENSARGIWALTPVGFATPSVDPALVNRKVKAADSSQEEDLEETGAEESLTEEMRWEDEALEVIKSIAPGAFETLCQRLLRESGFIQVEVTGRSGDGGIDGRGVVKLGGILSFHVKFQCKRYKDTVTASTVRDFRGAMVGRADKGLIISTGRFTPEARAEAQRDGAPPLDLIDGQELVQKLKELRLGMSITEKLIEEVTVDRGWFKSLPARQNTGTSRKEK